MMPSARAPQARHRLLHRGRMIRVPRAVVDVARAAQADPMILRFDVDKATLTAAEALKWLESTCFDANALWRMERRFRNPALAGGYDAAS